MRRRGVGNLLDENLFSPPTFLRVFQNYRIYDGILTQYLRIWLSAAEKKYVGCKADVKEKQFTCGEKIFSV